MIVIIKKKMEEHKKVEYKTVAVKEKQKITLGCFEIEFIHVNHSIADACAIALKTPVGTVIHTGDFKLDVSPLDGKIMDITRLGELGREGVRLLLCESTNAERPGFTPSERAVGSSLERLFVQYEKKRLIVATFSSNVHRVQQIIDTSVRHGRKVAITGRSMLNIVNAEAKITIPTDSPIIEAETLPIPFISPILLNIFIKPISSTNKAVIAVNDMVNFSEGINDNTNKATASIPIAVAIFP